MRYLIIADHVAHAAAKLLDLATHPEDAKSQVKSVIDSLRNAKSIEEILNNKTGEK